MSCVLFSFFFVFPFGVEFSVLDSLLCLLLWSEREGKRVFFCSVVAGLLAWSLCTYFLLFPFGTSIIWIQKRFGGLDLFISLTDAALWKIILLWFYWDFRVMVTIAVELSVCDFRCV